MTRTAKGKALDVAVKGLVTGALGCQCPDEVFETIDYLPPDDGHGGLLVRIGGRLMVRLLPVGKAGQIPELVGLLQDGRKERDRKRFNRFRLVLIVSDRLDNWQRIANVARASFDETIDQDGRVHIHVLASKELPKVLRARLGL